MNKTDILLKYPNQEDKFLISKILDKINFCQTRNKITCTNFLDVRQQNLISKLLANIKFKNYIKHGGFNNSERNCFIFYPDKFNEELVLKNIDNIILCIHIILPKELHTKYTHKDYLSGVMKLGIEREKIGDILVNDDGAYIITCADFAKSLTDLLSSLTRFSKSKIEIVKIDTIPLYEIKKEKLKIIVPSLRLDSIVSELAHTSRNKAIDLLNSERVLVNYEIALKPSKSINYGDIITIRGKGKFEIISLISKTKSGNLIVEASKYI